MAFRLASIAALLAAGLWFGAEIYVFGRPAFPLDDSWIHLHLARRLAEGQGLSFQGDRILPASTAPLWTGLLSIGFLLPGLLPLVWAKLLGLAAHVGTAAATGRLALAVGLSRRWSLGCALLMATTPWLLWSAMSAMEIGAFAALSTLGLALALEAEAADSSRRRLGAVACLAFAVLFRPEGALLLALLLAAWSLRSLARLGGARRLLAPIALAGLATLPTFLFYRLAGDSWLPTTYGAKAGGGLSAASSDYLRLVLDVFWRSQPVLLLFAASGGWILAARRRALPALWLLALPLVYSMLASPSAPPPLGNFGRYYFPVLPVLTIVGAVGLEQVVRTLADAGRKRLAAGAVGIVLAVHGLGLIQGPGRYLQTVANVEDSDVRAALWLADRLPDDAVLAVQDIGALAFFTRRPIVDLAGLVTPEILPVLRADPPGDWQRRLVDWLAAGPRPDYLVVFARSYPALAHSSAFPTIERFAIEDNVTMAGDELVILATPWTDAPLRPLVPAGAGPTLP
ncbi:MAG: hypothetical protein AAGN46_07970 [Acidobacteriota bacterium]